MRPRMTFSIPAAGSRSGQVLHAVFGETVADAEDSECVGALGDRVVGELPGEGIAAEDAQPEE